MYDNVALVFLIVPKSRIAQSSIFFNPFNYSHIANKKEHWCDASASLCRGLKSATRKALSIKWHNLYIAGWNNATIWELND